MKARSRQSIRGDGWHIRGIVSASGLNALARSPATPSLRPRRDRHRAQDVAGWVIGQDELCLSLDDRATLGLKADHVTHECVRRDASVAAHDMPGSGECDRVFDRHAVFQRILVDETYALDEMNLIAVWRARPVIG